MTRSPCAAITTLSFSFVDKDVFDDSAAEGGLSELVLSPKRLVSVGGAMVLLSVAALVHSSVFQEIID